MMIAIVCTFPLQMWPLELIGLVQCAPCVKGGPPLGWGSPHKDLEILVD